MPRRIYKISIKNHKEALELVSEINNSIKSLQKIKKLTKKLLKSETVKK